MNNNSNLEILLVLCCMVGVITFLSFSMGILTISANMEHDRIPDHSSLIKQKDALLTERKQKESEIERLLKMISEFKKEMEEKENKLESMKPSGDEGKSTRQEELAKLKKQLEELVEKIQEKENELELVKQSLVNIDEIKKKDAELELLKKELDELERKIKEKESELAKMPPSIDDALEKEVEKLRKAIKEAEEKKKTLDDKLRKTSDKDVFNPWKDFPGTLYLQNPLFVECKENLIVLYPDEKILTVSELDKKNPFFDAKQKHDSIVFLVRPNGFDTFEKSISKAKETKLSIAYEPIDFDWKLDVTKLGAD